MTHFNRQPRKKTILRLPLFYGGMSPEEESANQKNAKMSEIMTSFPFIIFGTLFAANQSMCVTHE